MNFYPAAPTHKCHHWRSDFALTISRNHVLSKCSTYWQAIKIVIVLWKHLCVFIILEKSSNFPTHFFHPELSARFLVFSNENQMILARNIQFENCPVRSKNEIASPRRCLLVQNRYKSKQIRFDKPFDGTIAPIVNVLSKLSVQIVLDK